MRNILESGPLFVEGYPLVLKQWTEKQSYIKEYLNSIPTWVKFPNLRISLKSPKALSNIASCIGRPICMDEHTIKGVRIDDARVLVEVTFDSKLLNSISILCKGSLFDKKLTIIRSPGVATNVGVLATQIGVVRPQIQNLKNSYKPISRYCIVNPLKWRTRIRKIITRL